MKDIFHPKEAKPKIVDTTKKEKSLTQEDKFSDAKITISSKNVPRKKISRGLMLFVFFTISLAVVSAILYFFYTERKDTQEGSSQTAEFEEIELEEINNKLEKIEDSSDNLTQDSSDGEVPDFDTNVTF